MASIARSKRKKGFGLSSTGFVYPFDPSAEELFNLGLFDDLKKRNKKTYEQLVCSLSDIPYEPTPPIYCLSEGEERDGQGFLTGKSLRKRPVVGMNTGGGTRWPLKRWTIEGFIQLGKKLTRSLGVQVLLFGGPSEVEINQTISAHLGKKVIDAGCFNPPRGFAALLNLCDVIVTGDSLALHIGLALHKRMVVLTGPTSAAEIDLYGMGEKITAEMDCLCCYRQVCDRSPNCMERISVETVFRSVEEQLNVIKA